MVNTLDFGEKDFYLCSTKLYLLMTNSDCLVHERQQNKFLHFQFYSFQGRSNFLFPYPNICKNLSGSLENPYIVIQNKASQSPSCYFTGTVF